MSNNIWFISDTHFGHGNLVLNFTLNDTGVPARVDPRTNARFNSVEEHDEYLIEQWNKNVQPQDKVWHLGDVIMGPKKDYDRTLSRLNGHKRLLLGNHDQLKGTTLSNWFEKIEVWRLFKEHNFIMTHVPIYRDQFKQKVQFNVHGHTHENNVDWIDDGHNPYINISCEKTALAPIHLEDLLVIIRERTLGNMARDVWKAEGKMNNV